LGGTCPKRGSPGSTCQTNTSRYAFLHIDLARGWPEKSGDLPDQSTENPFSHFVTITKQGERMAGPALPGKHAARQRQHRDHPTGAWIWYESLYWWLHGAQKQKSPVS
jgi:hypothetical protein